MTRFRKFAIAGCAIALLIGGVEAAKAYPEGCHPSTFHNDEHCRQLLATLYRNRRNRSPRQVTPPQVAPRQVTYSQAKEATYHRQSSYRSEGKPIRGYVSVIPQRRMSREQLRHLTWLAPGNSHRAMRNAFGMPYASDGIREEYFPLENDPSTWVRVRYDQWGRYEGYGFSVGNQVTRRGRYYAP